MLMFGIYKEMWQSVVFNPQNICLNLFKIFED